MSPIVRYFLFTILLLLVNPLWAQSPEPMTCPISLELNAEERDAYIMFHAHLSHLQRHYGKDSFQTKLNSIIRDKAPAEKVIEISPIFMEKVLYLIDWQYLRDSVERTIGLDKAEWQAFDRVIKYVMLHGYTTENKHGQFTKKTEALVKLIQNYSRSRLKTRGLTVEQANILKARAMTQIATMAITLGRWSIINNEVAAHRAQAAGKQLLFNMMTVSSGALLVASIVYAGPIVATVGTFAGALSADVVIAAQLARLGQVVAAVGMGAGGAPTGLLLTESTSAVLEAQRQASNNHSVYACELDQQFKQWQSRGISPYLNASLVGGSIGLFGGALTLTRVGAQFVLYATTFGVGIAEAYTIGKISENGIKSLAEYRLALEQQALGNNAQARIHLQNSRQYAKLGGEATIEAIVVGALAFSLSADFPAALREGETAIRVIFANSSDTLPMALGIAKESATQILGQ